MYNGIGLSTVRGSGTNGYVTRNLSYVRPSKNKVDYKTEEDIKKSEAALQRGPNQGILDHERKRKLEVKCLELEEVLREQGCDDEEVAEKVDAYRQVLIGNEQDKKAFHEVDDFGRPIVKDTHQIAQAQLEKNARLKDAFGLSKDFKDGSSFERNRVAQEKADEELKALMLKQQKKKRKKSAESSTESSDSDSDSESSSEEEIKKKKRKKSKRKKAKKAKKAKKSKSKKRKRSSSTSSSSDEEPEEKDTKKSDSSRNRSKSRDKRQSSAVRRSESRDDRHSRGAILQIKEEKESPPHITRSKRDQEESPRRRHRDDSDHRRQDRRHHDSDSDRKKARDSSPRRAEQSPRRRRFKSTWSKESAKES